MEKKKPSFIIRFVRWVIFSMAGFLVVGIFISFRPLHSGHTGESNCQNTAYNLKNAISFYFTEYRKYPVPREPREDVQLQSDHVLMDILLGSDPSSEGPDALNSRRIAFFTGKQAKQMGEGKYRKGVVLGSDGGGELWDPWGNYYRVLLDTNYDSRVKKPLWDQLTEAEELPRSILVWSAGPDGDFETWKDNVKTW